MLFVVGPTEFIVHHEDFNKQFLIKQKQAREDLTDWLKCNTHSNILTLYDQFSIDDELFFQMSETHNGGTLYQYIESLDLDLSYQVPLSYIELVYDVIIQMANALDSAHQNGLVHGNLSISSVMLHFSGAQKVLECKITDFRPTAVRQQISKTEANYWPFIKNKLPDNDVERLEMMMLKDIYNLGTCILELMIGRTAMKHYNIALDSVPLIWAEYAEAGPLISVLTSCVQLDSLSTSKGKLKQFKNDLIEHYLQFFKKPFYKLDPPIEGKPADVMNKLGVVALFNRDEDNAMRYWCEAKQINRRHFDSTYNYILHRWSTARINDERMMKEFDEFIFDVPNKGVCLKAVLLLAQGDTELGL